MPFTDIETLILRHLVNGNTVTLSYLSVFGSSPLPSEAEEFQNAVVRLSEDGYITIGHAGDDMTDPYFLDVRITELGHRGIQ